MHFMTNQALTSKTNIGENEFHSKMITRYRSILHALPGMKRLGPQWLSFQPVHPELKY